MSNKFEVRNVERGEIETIGAVIHERTFIPLAVVAAISISLLLVMSIGAYWPAICQRLEGALYGLIGGLYTMAIGMSTLVLSWLLVDDCSWFFKCSILFCSSLLFIVCGIYYFYTYFEAIECLLEDLSEEDYEFGPPSFPNPSRPQRDNITKFETENYSMPYLRLSDFLYTCYEDTILEENSAWTPILIVICVFVGVLYLMFAAYLCISLDEG